MTTTHEFDNSATQAERKAIVKNDSYFTRQSHTAEDSGGRYAKLTPATITGSIPLPQYPQLPASSPWSQFDQNVEPVLGFSVEEMPAQEIQPKEPTPSVASSAGVGSEPAGITPLVPAGSSTFKRRLEE